MYYGQTNRKIRSFFKELRKTARAEGGAIGFIEEIDAIAGARGGMSDNAQADGDAGRSVYRSDSARASAAWSTSCSIQMQSFDEPTMRRAGCAGWGIDRVNRFLPAAPPDPASVRRSASNILVIGATNRAADLDPALLRPGRFDRSIYFDLPGPRRAGARSSTTTWTRRRTSPSSTRTSGATSSPR